MADLFGILKNKALLMTLSKSDIMELINELNTAIETGDSTVVDLVKSYIDQQIAALPAGGIYQPISHVTKTVTFSSAGSAAFVDAIDTDSDMFILSVSGVRGTFTPNTSLIQPRFSFGFYGPAPGLAFRSMDTYTGNTMHTFNNSDLMFSLRSVYSRVTNAEMTFSPYIRNSDRFVSSGVLDSGDTFDKYEPTNVSPVKLFIDGETPKLSQCAITATFDVYNYRLDV